MGAGKTALDAVTGGAASGAAGAVGSEIAYGLGELLGTNKRRREQQLEDQQKLTDIQQKANLESLKYGNELQYDLWERTNYPAQVEKLKEAGLNPALLYGSAGEGGTTGGSAGGAVSGGQAADSAAREAAGIQKLGMGLEIRKKQAEVKLAEAQAKNTEAKTTTENEQRDILVEKLKQEGQKTWLENIRKIYENEKTAGNKDTVEIYGNKIYGATAITSNGAFNEQNAVAIAEAWADTGNKLAQQALTNEKTKGYWTELLNATVHADADKVKAAAIKLATEWNTGEYTNWKTWVETATGAINTITKIVK